MLDTVSKRLGVLAIWQAKLAVELIPGSTNTMTGFQLLRWKQAGTADFLVQMDPQKVDTRVIALKSQIALTLQSRMRSKSVTNSNELPSDWMTLSVLLPGSVYSYRGSCCRGVSQQVLDTLAISRVLFTFDMTRNFSFIFSVSAPAQPVPMNTLPAVRDSTTSTPQPYPLTTPTSSSTVLSSCPLLASTTIISSQFLTQSMPSLSSCSPLGAKYLPFNFSLSMIVLISSVMLQAAYITLTTWISFLLCSNKYSILFYSSNQTTVMLFSPYLFAPGMRYAPDMTGLILPAFSYILRILMREGMLSGTQIQQKYSYELGGCQILQCRYQLNRNYLYLYVQLMRRVWAYLSRWILHPQYFISCRVVSMARGHQFWYMPQVQLKQVARAVNLSMPSISTRSILFTLRTQQLRLTVSWNCSISYSRSAPMPYCRRSTSALPGLFMYICSVPLRVQVFSYTLISYSLLLTTTNYTTQTSLYPSMCDTASIRTRYPSVIVLSIVRIG